MLQYLVILMDDTSVAYCHADNPLKDRYLIPLEVLRRGIKFGMKHNLIIQYVFPEYALPQEYLSVIEEIDNVKIYPIGNKPETGLPLSKEADVVVASCVPVSIEAKNLILRLPFDVLQANRVAIAHLFENGDRFNICITDVPNFTDEDIQIYKQLLEDWAQVLLDLYENAKAPQVNLLTDRMALQRMRNCDAGVSNITLAPNGKFYLCPAFYYDEKMQVDNLLHHAYQDYCYSVGDLDQGLAIPNQHLLHLSHAPICRMCDAYQCKRCIWLNQKLTWDSNTPSHQQCVLAHLERNASRILLNNLSKRNTLFSSVRIDEIHYLVPFDVSDE